MRQRLRKQDSTIIRPQPEGCSSGAEGEEPSGNPDEASTPLVFSRAEEKKQLQELNDRLARYVDYIRTAQLSPDYSVNSDSIASSIKHLSELYGDELKTVRASLDRCAAELCQVRVRAQTAETARDEAEKAIGRAEERHAEQVKTLHERLARLEADLQRSKHLQEEYEQLKAQHAVLKEQLESETYIRTQVQNQLQTAIEEAQFKDKLLEEERQLRASRVREQTVTEEAQRYRSKLAAQLDQLREQMAEQLSEMLAKLKQRFKVQLAQERVARDAAEQAADHYQSELQRTRDEHAQTRTKLVSTRRQQSLLHRELRIYRALLELEERRCGLTPAGRKRVHATSVDLDAEQEAEEWWQQGSSLRVTCTASGPVHFAGADPGIGLVCVRNAGDEAIDLADWSMHFGPTAPAQTDQVQLHVFPKSFVLPPHSELQVFICPENDEQFPVKQPRAQQPAIYLVTSVPVWALRHSVIALRNPAGSVRAICEMEPAGPSTSLHCEPLSSGA